MEQICFIFKWIVLSFRLCIKTQCSKDVFLRLYLMALVRLFMDKGEIFGSGLLKTYI